MKPANVLLDRTGKHAKLADVGLAKVLERSQTMTNMVSIHWALHSETQLSLVLLSLGMLHFTRTAMKHSQV